MLIIIIVLYCYNYFLLLQLYCYSYNLYNISSNITRVIVFIENSMYCLLPNTFVKKSVFNQLITINTWQFNEEIAVNIDLTDNEKGSWFPVAPYLILDVFGYVSSDR